MLIRSLTLATLMAFTGPLLAADDLNPLKQDLGKSRPLIVFAPDSLDTLNTLKNAIEEPANKASFTQRNMVLYTVTNTSIGISGKRDGKDLGPQETNALVRALKLGAGSATKVILVGKDGETKLEKTVPPDTVELADLFSEIDKMPMAEKEAAAPAVPEPAAPPAGKAGTKPGKATKHAAPQPSLDD
ncbi:DUF4174 domain-containing protein [Pseudomonas sp. K2I15]|uniref:DUF4174 domain-containing protein n=1 Tax=unclassified Pseudomonas TaxID=196821 RepID=UPI000B4D6C27|nr:DUF4174 domain-containing protein [Pseudomonas sp. K2I15]OWP68703.1 tyrosyl-trna synthetase [Pseudomonas sp. K2I15]